LQGGKGQHAAQAGQAGATQPVHQYSLGLVVGVVTYGNRLGPCLAGDTRQEGISGTAGRFFDSQAVLTSQGRDVGMFNRAGQLPISGQGLDELGVGVGVGAAQAVVEMSDVQVQVMVGAQPAQEVQQTERIRPAGYTDHYSLAARQQVIALDRPPDLIQEVGHQRLTTDSAGAARR
jgi:hypothetical protein